jgi:hypothetical protein
VKIEIKNRYTGSVIFETEAVDLREAVVLAVKAKTDLSSADLRSANLSSADLSYANLRSANLRSADLSYADLSSADLRYADLSSANLSSANLRSANLRSADLRSADLDRKTILSWSSHELIARILFNDAGNNIERRKIAGLILISKDWCWDELFKIETPERAWAIEVLKSQNPEGMPEILKNA